jgi:hypothetical protein
MKKFKTTLWTIMVAVAILTGLSSCADEVVLPQSFEHLEEQAERMNEELNALKELVHAIEANQFVVKIDSFIEPDDPSRSGYIVHFAGRDPIILYNGENGETGETPVISVAANDEGYFWTVNGRPLLAPGTQDPIRVTGFTPLIRINPDTGGWEASYGEKDGRGEYIFVSLDYSATGDSFFSGIDNSHEEYIVLILAGGETIKIPKYVEPKPIEEIILSEQFPAPLAGATPVISFSAGTYSGTVQWTPAHGLFLADTFYNADLTLNAATGYYFPKNIRVIYRMDGDVAGDPANAAGSADETENKQWKGVIAFPAAEHTGKPVTSPVDLTAFLPSPVKGSNPLIAFSDGVNGIGGTVVWQQRRTDDDAPAETPETPDEAPDEADEWVDMPLPGLFSEDEYRALVTLKPLDGYVFGDNVFARHEYARDDDVKSPQGVRFDLDEERTQATGAILFQTVTVVQEIAISGLHNLTRYIPAPVAGNTPVPSFPGTNYVGHVTWQALDDATWKEGDVFMQGVRYVATVILTPAPGYYFSDTAVFRYGLEELSSIDFSAEDRHRATGLIEFPTGALAGTLINEILLTSALPAPTKGATMLNTFTSTYCTGSVTWTPATTATTFQPETVYGAAITLTPVIGCRFPAAGESVRVTHDQANGGVAVSFIVNAQGTCTGTLVFAATESGTPVDDRDLTGKLSRPTLFADTSLAVTNFVFPQYAIASVEWTATRDDSGSGTPATYPYDKPSGPEFQFFMAYRASLRLGAAKGYSFPQGINFIHRGDAGSVVAVRDRTATGDSITVDVNFTRLQPTTFATGEASIIRAIRSAMEAKIEERNNWDVENDKDNQPFQLEHLKIELPPGRVDESVTLSEPNSQLGTQGLVLNHLVRLPFDYMPSHNSPGILEIDGGGRTITLVGDNPAKVPLITLYNLSVAGVDESWMYWFPDDSLTLILRNITLKGRSPNYAPLIQVGRGANLILGEGATITGNVNNGSDNNRSHGGGVLARGTVILDGGVIRDNEADLGGGVYLEPLAGSDALGAAYGNAQLIVNKGAIRNNRTLGYDGSGAGVYVGAAAKGQQVSVGRLTLNGGDIHNNEARMYDAKGGGVYIGSVLKDDGTYIGGELVLTGGAIHSNVAWSSGAGVYMNGATQFYMSGGAIRNNHQTNTFNNSTRLGQGGGGVCVGSIVNAGGVVGSTFTMDGGVIAGNHLLLDGTQVITEEPIKTKGAGVYVDTVSVFTKTGGTIYGLFNETGSGWEEDVTQQNYVGSPIRQVEEEVEDEDEEEEEVVVVAKPGYALQYPADVSKLPGGLKRGYAVYFRYGDPSSPDDVDGRWCDRTVTGPLSTDDAKAPLSSFPSGVWNHMPSSSSETSRTPLDVKRGRGGGRTAPPLVAPAGTGATSLPLP